MPKWLEDKLKREATRKGLTGKRKQAYIYSTMRKKGYIRKSADRGSAWNWKKL